MHIYSVQSKRSKLLRELFLQNRRYYFADFLTTDLSSATMDCISIFSPCRICTKKILFLILKIRIPKSTSWSMMRLTSKKRETNWPFGQEDVVSMRRVRRLAVFQHCPMNQKRKI